MKALVGSWDHRPYQLLAEVTALRAKVAELQQELRAAHESNEALRAALSRVLEDDVAQVPVVDTSEDVEIAVSAR